MIFRCLFLSASRTFQISASSSVYKVFSRSIYNMAAPGNLMRFDYAPSDLSGLTDKLIKSSRGIYDQIGALKDEEVSIDSVVKVLADDMRDYSQQYNNIDCFQSLSPSKEMRDASVAASKVLADFDVEKSMRKDVFDKLVIIEAKFADKLDAESKRLVERLIKLGRRNGLHLPEGIQNEVKDILKQINQACIEFSNNLDEENTKLEFTAEELDGVPEDFLKSLKKTDSGKLEVTLKYPHYIPCMQYAKQPSTRKTLESAFNQRCIKENTILLEKVIALRHQKAQLLGYKTHADFILEMRMAKSEPAVASFLSELAKKLQPLKNEEMKLFMEYKKKDCEELKIDFDNRLNMYDYSYYITRAEEKKYSVDKNKLREYFPMATVTKGLLDIYQELLGVKYECIEKPAVWQEDVTLYSVKDASDGRLIGYFYMDMYPREGKFGHAACFPMQAGCDDGKGGRQLPVAALVCNFTKPTEDQPDPLLTHQEVETFFHEFGHTMHHVCSEAKYSLFSGTHVERDFVEAPSQMLENWVWYEESLHRMSKHYKDGSAIPADLLKCLIDSRKANAGIFNLRQIFLATFDQTIHKMEKVDTQKVLGDLSKSILDITISPGTNMSASFGHLMGGYDAQYYGYMWSEVYSADMFYSRFAKEGIFNKSVGRDYRREILKPGGSIDATDMLRNFLGREPSQEPFLKSKGLSN